MPCRLRERPICVREPSIICHFGGAVAPENTLVAGRLALDAGAEMLAVDVRQSRDGVLYLLRDARLGRTTNGRGAISDMGSLVLDDLDAGAWFAPEFAGEPLPQLENYLSRLHPPQGYLLDVRQADPERLAGALLAAEAGARSVVLMREPEAGVVLRQAAPRVRQAIDGRLPGALALLREGDFLWLPYAALRVDLLFSLRARGVRVLLHLPVRDPVAYRQALSLGVACISVGHPGLARHLRKVMWTQGQGEG